MVEHPLDVAICTLNEHRLAARLHRLPRVALAAPLATANLGIEELVVRTLAMRHVRHIVVCGPDSSVFKQGQSLLALMRSGCTKDGRIIGAQGYQPRLVNLRPAVIDEFRTRIRMHDLVGERDVDRIATAVAAVPSLPSQERVEGEGRRVPLTGGARLRRMVATGSRVPMTLAEGFFVVSVDRCAHRIVARHYQADLTSGEELIGKSAQAVLLGIVRLGLVTEPAHAGYLGVELAKAETALRLGLDYRQDLPLPRPRRNASPTSSHHCSIRPGTAEASTASST